MIAQNLCSKIAYIRRKIDVKTTKCRDFARILTIFLLNSYIRRNIIVKPSQRRYSTAILREKKVCEKRAPALAYTAVYGVFAPRFYFFRAKTSSLFVGKAPVCTSYYSPLPLQRSLLLSPTVIILPPNPESGGGDSKEREREPFPKKTLPPSPSFLGANWVH